MIRCWLAALAVLVLMGGGVALGASQPVPPNGITVSPALRQISLPAGTAEQPVNFYITNHKPTAQTISLSTADFNSLSDTGGLFFVGANPTELQKKYGLAKWVSLPYKQVTIQPRQTVTVTAKILNLPEMSAGGHYGALMLSLGSPSGQTSGGKVAVHPVASSLMFVTKLGGDTHKLSLAAVDIKRTPFTMPGSVTLHFHNDGNTHLVPRGVVTVTDSSKHVISKGIINENSGIILPQTSRDYYVPLRSLAAAAKPGSYKLLVDFRFDGINQYRRYQTSFWLMPTWLLVVVMLGLAVIALAIAKRHKLLVRLRHQPKTKK